LACIVQVNRRTFFVAAHGDVCVVSKFYGGKRQCSCFITFFVGKV
jgi:hypothetical protein